MDFVGVLLVIIILAALTVSWFAFRSPEKSVVRPEPMAVPLSTEEQWHIDADLDRLDAVLLHRSVTRLIEERNGTTPPAR